MDLGADGLPARAAALPALPGARRLRRARRAGTQERYPVKTRQAQAQAARRRLARCCAGTARCWLVQRPPTRHLGRAVEPAGVRLPMAALTAAAAGWPGARERAAGASSTCSPTSTGRCTRCAGRCRRGPRQAAGRDRRRLAGGPLATPCDEALRAGPAGAVAQAAGDGRLARPALGDQPLAQRTRRRVEPHRAASGSSISFCFASERHRQDLAPAVGHPAGVCRTEGLEERLGALLLAVWRWHWPGPAPSRGTLAGCDGVVVGGPSSDLGEPQAVGLLLARVGGETIAATAAHLQDAGLRAVDVQQFGEGADVVPGTGFCRTLRTSPPCAATTTPKGLLLAQAGAIRSR